MLLNCTGTDAHSEVPGALTQTALVCGWECQQNVTSQVGGTELSEQSPKEKDIIALNYPTNVSEEMFSAIVWNEL